MKKALLLLILVASGLVIEHFGFSKMTVKATAIHQAPLSSTTPTTFSLIALESGWNSSLPPGTVTQCTSTGPGNCNPTITQFRGVAFTATLRYGGAPELTHTFALYTAQVTPDNVSIFDTCSLNAQNGCIKSSGCIGTSTSSPPCSTSVRSFSFSPTIPIDGPPFLGPGVYQYYCQYHPGTMHGQFQILKNPDVDKDGTVTITDLAFIAFYFGQNTTSVSQPADLNNDGKINILDLAADAFYFGDTI